MQDIDRLMRGRQDDPAKGIYFPWSSEPFQPRSYFTPFARSTGFKRTSFYSAPAHYGLSSVQKIGIVEGRDKDEARKEMERHVQKDPEQYIHIEDNHDDEYPGQQSSRWGMMRMDRPYKDPKDPMFGGLPGGALSNVFQDYGLPVDFYAPKQSWIEGPEMWDKPIFDKQAWRNDSADEAKGVLEGDDAYQNISDLFGFAPLQTYRYSRIQPWLVNAYDLGNRRDARRPGLGHNGEMDRQLGRQLVARRVDDAVNSGQSFAGGTIGRLMAPYKRIWDLLGRTAHMGGEVIFSGSPSSYSGGLGRVNGVYTGMGIKQPSYEQGLISSDGVLTTPTEEATHAAHSLMGGMRVTDDSKQDIRDGFIHAYVPQLRAALIKDLVKNNGTSLSEVQDNLSEKLNGLADRITHGDVKGVRRFDMDHLTEPANSAFMLAIQDAMTKQPYLGIWDNVDADSYDARSKLRLVGLPRAMHRHSGFYGNLDKYRRYFLDRYYKEFNASPKKWEDYFDYDVRAVHHDNDHLTRGIIMEAIAPFINAALNKPAMVPYLNKLFPNTSAELLTMSDNAMKDLDELEADRGGMLLNTQRLARVPRSSINRPPKILTPAVHGHQPTDLSRPSGTREMR